MVNPEEHPLDLDEGALRLRFKRGRGTRAFPEAMSTQAARVLARTLWSATCALLRSELGWNPDSGAPTPEDFGEMLFNVTAPREAHALRMNASAAARLLFTDTLLAEMEGDLPVQLSEGIRARYRHEIEKLLYGEMMHPEDLAPSVTESIIALLSGHVTGPPFGLIRRAFGDIMPGGSTDFFLARADERDIERFAVLLAGHLDSAGLRGRNMLLEHFCAMVRGMVYERREGLPRA